MHNFESPQYRGGINLDNQAPTRQGRERQYTQIIERRKEGVEIALSQLLNFVSEKLGKEITLADLKVEFGTAGENIESLFQAVISEVEEGESINKTARFIAATANLKHHIEEQH